ncbi:hypothetical protein CC80DRAFT_419903 [Byssothecium circinans]|uniref:Carrier domain-containing protein n=1 Tax=Byssothecium circinans TaxID=147558 RepID=A0A6A5TSG4_9PLEO|nr:hypothetical protein CC80DRAFT_419903 [Byssothecium circinans]
MFLQREPIPGLSVLNRQPKSLDGPRLLHDLVRNSSPTNAPAIDFLEHGSKKRALTYEHLHASSDTLARNITRSLAGLKNASAIVPVLLPQSPELYVTLLAILKAGKAFCPIGLDTPKERLEFILGDISANILITDSSFTSCLENLHVLPIDEALSEHNDASHTKPPRSKTTDLAYVLYTSGSTGLPKAVSVSHRAITQSLLAHDRHIPRFSRFLQFAAPTFDVSIFEIFFPLYRGCTLVGCTRPQMLSDLPGIITSLSIDAAELTPTVVSNLLKRRSNVPGLKLLLTIGEMLTRHVIEEFGGKSPEASILWGMYGPTEAAIHCTLQPRFTTDFSVGNIGVPFDTVSAFIALPIPSGSADSRITILPTGEIGELVIGGLQVAEEYLNRPELTEAAFVRDPELGYLYRTGDKARLTLEGTLECLGRIVSGQVKLRGQRVELGEIEDIILKAGACNSTTVLIIEDALVAFCAISSDEFTTDLVFTACRLRLPNYMVPSEVIPVKSMPQLPSGKIDRKALEAQFLQNRRQNGTSTSLLKGETESYLADIIRKNLSQDEGEEGPYDLTTVDSLHSILIASALRERGYTIAPVDILSARTLTQLAQMCGKVGKSEPTRALNLHSMQIPVNAVRELWEVRDDVQEIFPCTPLQEAMLTETDIKPSAYCNWIEVELQQPLTCGQIRQHLEHLVAENQILRTGFLATTSTSESFIQVVWKSLAPFAIREVMAFSRSYSLGSIDSLLRPLSIQIIASSPKPRLLFQIHHALYDGWSFDLLMHDLNQLILGRAVKHRPQYRDVVQYYKELPHEDLSKAEAYWSRLLHGFSPKPMTNFNGRLMRSDGLCTVRGETSVDARSLFARANTLSMNPQVFFQAAVAYVVSLYMGSSDAVIGTVTSGRTIPLARVEDVIGPCLASLPFRLKLSESATVKDILKETQKANRSLLQHCTLPLRDITKLCGLRPGKRLFDVLFVWQQSLVSNDNENLRLKVVDSEDCLESKLILEFEPREDRILYRTTYDPSIIPEKQVRFLSLQIDHVVTYFLSHINSRVCDIAGCFSPNITSIANPAPRRVLFQRGPAHAVEEWAARAPKKDALVLGAVVDGVMQAGETLTYASLNARANQLACTLIEHGVGKDQLLCIIMDKCIDLYVSILAALKVGCGYLPITPDTPLERVRRILADAEVDICISNSLVSDGLPRDECIVLELDKLDLLHCSDQNLEIPYDGSHLAYAIFTSGSTGNPKGVLITQDNLMSNLEYLSSLYPISSDSRLLQCCSQGFDVSVFEIFFSWYVGITLCTATKTDLFYDFGAAINSLDITHLSLTPTVAGLVDPSQVPKVKFLVTAGEALTENVRRKWAGKGLFQGYGPSETTNICTARPYVTADDLINNIGKPFPNTSALVLAPGMDHILARGAVGELCFGGAQVFRGYLKMPQLNAEKIVNHPQYGRLYRSGDMGLLLPDDSILCTGRIDDQVKIRGQRVELGEITSTVLDHPSVADCTTLLVQHEHGAQGLVCFWVPTRASATAFKMLPPVEFRSIVIDLFETASLQLPSYMVPSHFVPITCIPMTQQAKIDKRFLKSTFESLPTGWLDSTASSQESEDLIEELSTSEQKIVEVLARTLNMQVGDVRRSSSFFNLGIDSVSGIRVAQGLRNAGFDQASVSRILENPSVKRLSLAMTQESRTQTLTTSRQISVSDVFNTDLVAQIKNQFRSRGEEVQEILPCTPLQEAMLSNISPSELGSYYNTMVFEVYGQLDHLKQCWECMFERHQILRTAFIATDDAQYAFAQVVLAPKAVQWQLIGPNINTATHFKRQLQDLLAKQLPPVQVGIQRFAASARIVFSCHHALYDGSAISTLLHEIQKTYREGKLPQPISYEKYLRHMINQDYVAAEDFWASHLTGFEPTVFPNISNRAPQACSKNFAVERVLTTSLSDALEFCQSSSISLLALIQASWAKLLHFCTGENDICFGNVVSGRTLPEEGLERLVAPCFNTIPVRLDFDFGRSNAELCKQLHTFNIDCLPYQLTPLRRIQSRVLRDHRRLFDTLVILQQPSSPLDDSIWSLEQDAGEMDLPVVCEAFQDKTRNIMKLMLHYSNSLMLQSDANVLAEVFDKTLQSLIRSPSSPASDTGGFPSQLLGQANMNWDYLNPPRDGLLHSAFELNAAESPDVPALEFLHSNGQRTTMSFKALNEEANQVAHALIQRDIQTEDVVPVHMPKSPQFYISILGILKAGAAFSPIHPDLPEERKRFMLTELRPKIMLCLDNTPTPDWCGPTSTLGIDDTEDFPRENPCVRGLRPTSLAYCLYTSGSTGLPKAVAMEHRAPIQTIESSRKLIPWNQCSRLLQYAAIAFDMCYYDCFLAWTFGFTLCATDQDAMLNNLADTINTLNVDLLDLTPSIAQSLRRAEVTGVKWLYCIGEAMTADVVKEWEGACVNSYGPTEAAFCTTIFPVEIGSKTSIIGKPFSTTSFAVFPSHGDRPLPILGAGELYMGGAQLARGYFKNTRLSDNRFVYKCGQRLYKSGDMVRLLSDGNFEFLGRADDQVKIRGLRVELGEIDHVLRSCDERLDTATTQILKQDAHAKDQLVAFLVANPQVSEEERPELRQKAKQAATDRLPAYMVPQFFVFIDKLPRSMAGKVDKKALTQLFRDSDEMQSGTPSESESTSHNWTGTERLIRDAFAKLSNISKDKIFPETTIYQLGLDSISAVQIAGALRKRNFEVNAADVMKYMDCKELAAYLDRNSSSTEAKVEPFDYETFERRYRTEVVSTYRIKNDEVEAIMPCTPLQSGILSQFLAKDGNIYFNYLRLRLDDNIKPVQMKGAWSTVMRKHQMLHTGFAHIKDSKMPFVMIQYRKDSIHLPSDDNARQTSSTADHWLAETRQKAARQLHRPPWRIRMVKENGEVYLDLALLHAIFDAQSLRLILDDLKAIFNKSFNSEAVPLEPVLNSIIQPSLFSDVQQAEFWRQIGKTSTPSRFPILAPLRYEASPPDIVTKIASRTLAELDSGCRRANTSLQVAAMASWATLLASYTGESSATFGVVLSGRNFDGAHDAVFPCITTVPFTCEISDRKEDVLKEVMGVNVGIQQHQFTPLNEIQKLMGYPNEPLFDSIFAFQKLSISGNGRNPWTIVDEKATTEYHISIELEPKGHELEYRLTFLPHLVPKEQASLLLEQLDHLLQSYLFTGTADERAFDPKLYSLTPAKEGKIRSKAQLLHEMVEAAASKYPNRIALEFVTSLRNGKFESKKWTYSQLDTEGNRIVHLLLAHAVRPGELVGVCFDKCPEASFAMLGILKAGCAFVALDPGAPSARKGFIVKDSGAKIVMSMSAQSAGMKENVEATILNLDQIDTRSIPTKSPVLPRAIDPQDRSYCLYTSGTTGTPKGCELTHENAVQAMLSFERLFNGHWDAASRWLQFASFHFDVSVLEQYWSWYVGICVVSAPRDLIFEDLAASIRTLGITHLDLTPSLARILHPDDVPSLCKGVFITGGESLKQEILDVWGPKGVIYNGYGPTEATIGVTMYPRVPVNGKPSNIGPQFDNVGSYVLRPGSDIPVLRGGVGELCVSGKLIGKGYLNRPDLTNKAFPMLARFHERVYRTGDLVRILHDGSFEFLGRADDQIKLRGQRLEIGEINAVMKQSTITVADAATLVLKHPKQQKEQLVAFVVLGSNDKGPSRIMLEKTNQLTVARQACQDKLPPYMVPTHFVALTVMPLNVNNKADAKRLKKMYGELSASDLQTLSSVSQPKHEEWELQEQKIRHVLRGVLELKEDGFNKDASFFELGMDSISVIGVSRALKQAGFSKAAPSIVMKNATVRRLAKILSERSSASSNCGSIIAAQQAITAVQHRHRRNVAETLFMDARNIEALAPCTPLQQGLIARSFESDNGLYFNTFRFKLTREVDVQKLQRAWDDVFATTQILRTVFVNTEDGFVQAALRKASLRFDYITLDNEDKMQHALEKRRMEWVQHNQSIIKTPLELTLIKAGEQKTLVAHIFHALYDGISIELVFRSVWDAYSEREIRSGPPFQCALAHGPLRSIAGAREFWEDHIAMETLKRFPDMNNTSNQASVSASKTISDLEDLEPTRRKLNVTAQAISQACWTNVLHRHIKGTVTLGLVLSGRSIDFEGADKVNGPLFNTIPYQYRPQQSETWASVVERTHNFNVAAHPFQHTPLRDIMKWCKRGSSQPLFDTLFVYQVTNDHDTWMKNEAWELMDGDAVADYPLAVEIEQRGGSELKITLVAQWHIADEERLQELLDQFENALRESLANPDAEVEVTPDDGEAANDLATSQSNRSDSRQVDRLTSFRWTKNATILRAEIARLADVDESSIDESTSIFEVGLDSIDAIKLASILKKRGIELAVSGIMRSLIIANMLDHISTNKWKVNERPSDMIYQSHKRRLESYLRHRGLTEGVEKILPLTPLQEAMVAEMVASDYTRYYNHDVLKLHPHTDLDRLQYAWTEVVRHSPILRTSFIQVDDPSIDSSFAQVVHERPHAFSKSVRFDEEPDFPNIFETMRQQAVSDPVPGPLFYVQLIKAPKQTYLVLSIAHALYDGWSLGLLHQDVNQAYNGRFQPRPNYESALVGILMASGPDAVAFWRDNLSDAHPALFSHGTACSEDSLQRVHRKEQVSRLTLRDVAVFANKTGISLQTLGQTVYALVLALYTRSMDVTFGSVLSGRDDDQRSKLLFPTMNTVAIRAILHGTRREMLQYVQENFSNIKQWQHFPLRKALALAGVEGTLFESLFIYQRSMGVDKDAGTLYESVQGQSYVEYPVCVEMEVVREGLVWRCAVKEEVFDDAGAQELLNRLDDVMRDVINRPDAATIDFTPDGMSICELPTFENDHPGEDNGAGLVESEATQHSNSATQSVIREVLAFVSKIPEEEIDEDMTIFHIGLDSISAIKVSSLLRKRGVSLSVSEMMSAGTVERMARLMDERSTSNHVNGDDPDAATKEALAGIDPAAILKRAGVEEDDLDMMLPATAGQTYMLFMWLNSRGAMFYPEFRYEIRGAVSFDSLRTKCETLFEANSILRTIFFTAEDERLPFVQFALRKSRASIRNITGWAEEDVVKALDGCNTAQPFVHLFASQSPVGWDLRLKIHHALYDGVSLSILMQKLQDLCNGKKLASQSNVFTRLVAITSTPSALDARKAFWTKYLKSVEQKRLPQPISTPTSKTEIFQPGLVPDVTLLETLVRKNGTSMQSLFLATYAKLYARLTFTPPNNDIIIGIYLANRSHSVPNLAEATIPTVNLVPLRISTPLALEILDVAAQIQYDIQEISSVANAGVSLWEVEKWTSVRIDCWVNFLKLPSVEETDEEHEGVKIAQREQWEGDVSRVTSIETDDLDIPEGLGERINRTRTGAYLHSLDIEATVRNDALDVGIFAPEEMVGLSCGEGLMRDIKMELEGLVEEMGD